MKTPQNKTTEELCLALALEIDKQAPGNYVWDTLDALERAVMAHWQIDYDKVDVYDPDPEKTKKAEENLTSKRMEILRASEMMAAKARELALAFKLRDAWQAMLPGASIADQLFFQAPKWEKLRVDWNGEIYDIDNRGQSGWALCDTAGRVIDSPAEDLTEPEAKSWAEKTLLEMEENEIWGSMDGKLYNEGYVVTRLMHSGVAGYWLEQESPDGLDEDGDQCACWEPLDDEQIVAETEDEAIALAVKITEWLDQKVHESLYEIDEGESEMWAAQDELIDEPRCHCCGDESKIDSRGLCGQCIADEVWMSRGEIMEGSLS